MTAPAQVLAAAGVHRADDVLTLAGRAGLDVACAAVLLVKESGGGRNVWGHDPVATGGAYTKGGPVTQANYAAYRRARAGRTAGQQGCGPTQLTLDNFQLRADKAGGCWNWEANCLTGFGILADLIRQHGERDGFRRYNGSGPAAERYAADAVARLASLRAQLGGPDQLPTLRQGDRGSAVAALQRFLNRYGWRPPLPVLNPDGVYGPATVAVVRAAQEQCGVTGPDADGTICGPRTNAAFWARGYRG